MFWGRASRPIVPHQPLKIKFRHPSLTKSASWAARPPPPAGCRFWGTIALSWERTERNEQIKKGLNKHDVFSGQAAL